MSRTDLLPDAGPVLSLRQALYRAGRDYHGGITALAHDLGMDLDSLQKKLKLNEERRWPTPDEMEEIVGATKDPRLLDAFNRAAGVVWYRPVPVNTTPEALAALADKLEKESKYVRSLHEGVEDNRWQPHEVAELEFHTNEVIRILLGILAGARSAMEGQQHG